MAKSKSFNIFTLHSALYFECMPNCRVWVSPNALKKRLCVSCVYVLWDKRAIMKWEEFQWSSCGCHPSTSCPQDNGMISGRTSSGRWSPANGDIRKGPVRAEPGGWTRCHWGNTLLPAALMLVRTRILLHWLRTLVGRAVWPNSAEEAAAQVRAVFSSHPDRVEALEPKVTFKKSGCSYGECRCVCGGGGGAAAGRGPVHCDCPWPAGAGLRAPLSLPALRWRTFLTESHRHEKTTESAASTLTASRTRPR